MTEIYTNSAPANRTVVLDFPYLTGATIDAVVVDDLGEELFVFTGPAGATGPADGPDSFITLTLPLFLCQFDSRLHIQYEVTYFEDANDQTYTIAKDQPVDIVTPILTKAEIKAVWETATDTEVVTIEKAVRHVIQAYTGQEFGRYIGTLACRGTGGETLALPRRLMELTGFEGYPATPVNFVIQNNGYTLRHYPWGVPPVKADAWGLHMHVGGVIHNPNNVKVETFANNRDYLVEGHWGWPAVPDAVKEAAKLLVNDYACADAQYRDRYLVSMTAADWRIQFYSGAYLRTGNVRADQLLSDYVVTRGWGVI